MRPGDDSDAGATQVTENKANSNKDMESVWRNAGVLRRQRNGWLRRLSGNRRKSRDIRRHRGSGDCAAHSPHLEHGAHSLIKPFPDNQLPAPPRDTQANIDEEEYLAMKIRLIESIEHSPALSRAATPFNT